jgi:hypothetical protein
MEAAASLRDLAERREVRARPLVELARLVIVAGLSEGFLRVFREGANDRGPRLVQFSSLSPGTRLNSCTWLVTSVSPADLA